MKRIFMLVVTAMMATVMIHAQIDPQVIEVLKKSQEKDTYIVKMRIS